MLGLAVTDTLSNILTGAAKLLMPSYPKISYVALITYKRVRLARTEFVLFLPIVLTAREMSQVPICPLHRRL